MSKPAPFVLVSTQHGSMIVNHLDRHMVNQDTGYGVGYSLLQNSSYETNDNTLLKHVAKLRRKTRGDGVVAIDAGANIGVVSLELGNAMQGWGHVYAFEAQEKIFYALAGNIALNNVFNVTARHQALGASNGNIVIPQPDYTSSGSFGSLELKQKPSTEFIGQNIDYDRGVNVTQVTIDSLSLKRVDLMKIDVEGMEEEVLTGSEQTIQTHHPILFIEVIKSNKEALFQRLSGYGYQLFHLRMNTLAIHKTDPCIDSITVNGDQIVLSM